jgi:hypothetical protein
MIMLDYDKLILHPPPHKSILNHKCYALDQHEVSALYVGLYIRITCVYKLWLYNKYQKLGDFSQLCVLYEIVNKIISYCQL